MVQRTRGNRGRLRELVKRALNRAEAVLVRRPELVNQALNKAGVALVRYPTRDAGRDEQLGALLKRLQINCVLDVGAHRGEYGRELRDLGYRGEIVSFEPMSASYAELDRTTAGDELWRVRQMALGSEAGRLALNVTRGTTFASFLEPSEWARSRYPGVAVEREEEVAVERLDRVFDDVTAHVAAPRVLLKIDTQGWDQEVIKGAAGCVDRILALETELSVQPVYDGATGYLDSLARLSEIGFEPVHLSTESCDEQHRVTELNCLMLRTAEPPEALSGP